MLASYEYFGALLRPAERPTIAVFLAMPFLRRRVSDRLAFVPRDGLTVFSWWPCFVS
jgi:hypothetical protein